MLDKFLNASYQSFNLCHKNEKDSDIGKGNENPASKIIKREGKTLSNELIAIKYLYCLQKQ